MLQQETAAARNEQLNASVLSVKESQPLRDLEQSIYQSIEHEGKSAEVITITLLKGLMAMLELTDKFFVNNKKAIRSAALDSYTTQLMTCQGPQHGQTLKAQFNAILETLDNTLPPGINDKDTQQYLAIKEFLGNGETHDRAAAEEKLTLAAKLFENAFAKLKSSSFLVDSDFFSASHSELIFVKIDELLSQIVGLIERALQDSPLQEFAAARELLETKVQISRFCDTLKTALDYKKSQPQAEVTEGDLFRQELAFEVELATLAYQQEASQLRRDSMALSDIADEQIQQLEETNEQLKQENSKLKAELEQTKKSKTTLEEDVTRLEENISRHESALSEALEAQEKQMLKSRNVNISANNSFSAEHEQTIHKLEQEIAELQKALQNAQTEELLAMKKIVAAREELDQQKSDNSVLQAQIRDLEQQIEVLDEELKTKEMQLNRLLGEAEHPSMAGASFLQRSCVTHNDSRAMTQASILVPTKFYDVKAEIHRKLTEKHRAKQPQTSTPRRSTAAEPAVLELENEQSSADLQALFETARRLSDTPIDVEQLERAHEEMSSILLLVIAATAEACEKLWLHVEAPINNDIIARELRRIKEKLKEETADQGKILAKVEKLERQFLQKSIITQLKEKMVRLDSLVEIFLDRATSLSRQRLQVATIDQHIEEIIGQEKVASLKKNKTKLKQWMQIMLEIKTSEAETTTEAIDDLFCARAKLNKDELAEAKDLMQAQDKLDRLEASKQSIKTEAADLAKQFQAIFSNAFGFFDTANRVLKACNFAIATGLSPEKDLLIVYLYGILTTEEKTLDLFSKYVLKRNSNEDAHAYATRLNQQKLTLPGYQRQKNYDAHMAAITSCHEEGILELQANLGTLLSLLPDPEDPANRALTTYISAMQKNLAETQQHLDHLLDLKKIFEDSFPTDHPKHKQIIGKIDAVSKLSDEDASLLVVWINCCAALEAGLVEHFGASCCDPSMTTTKIAEYKESALRTLSSSDFPPSRWVHTVMLREAGELFNDFLAGAPLLKRVHQLVQNIPSKYEAYQKARQPVTAGDNFDPSFFADDDPGQAATADQSSLVMVNHEDIADRENRVIFPQKNGHQFVKL